MTDEKFADETDEDILIGPTNWLFEDWKIAAGSYTSSHFPDWHPRMVKRFLDDIAWEREGCVLTPSTMEQAVSDWFSGVNSYSPHTVPLEGYDYGEWMKREKQKSYYALVSFGCDNGIDEQTAQRFAKDALKASTMVYSDDFGKALEAWISGDNPYSPHSVPFDEKNLEERTERRAELRRLYSHLSDFSFKLYFLRRLTVSPFVEKIIESKRKNLPDA